MAEHLWRIYRYYNPIEDKSYIGQTTRNVNARAGNGKGYQEGTKFRNAIDKYGWHTFELSILKLCTSQEDANYWERYFIDKFDSIDNGYNTKPGGYYFISTEEIKKKKSAALKGKLFTEEHKKHIAENHWDCSGINHPMYGITGEKNPKYGKKCPEHSKRMTGEGNPMFGRTGEKSPNYGKTWYNNGTINICININTTEIPDGFKKGRLYERRAK